MHFDLTINISTLIAFAVLLLSFLKAHISNQDRLKAIETKMEMLYEWWKNHGRVR